MAMDAEFNALLHNQTRRLVPLSPGMNVMGYKWVFRVKRKVDRTIQSSVGSKGF